MQGCHRPLIYKTNKQKNVVPVKYNKKGNKTKYVCIRDKHENNQILRSNRCYMYIINMYI